jgi:hypothetical protein
VGEALGVVLGAHVRAPFEVENLRDARLQGAELLLDLPLDLANPADRLRYSPGSLVVIVCPSPAERGLPSRTTRNATVLFLPRSSGDR